MFKFQKTYLASDGVRGVSGDCRDGQTVWAAFDEAIERIPLEERSKYRLATSGGPMEGEVIAGGIRVHPGDPEFPVFYKAN